MNTKENVREQLQEKDWVDLQAIMCEFFVSQANSWQAELLDWVTDELPDADWQVRDKMIDKIVAEVKVEDLVECGWIEHPLQDIIDEFNVLRSAIEPLSWYEVEEIWCTLGESDNEVELDVSEPDSLIIAVYADVNKQTGDVKLSADHITVRDEDGHNEVVNLSKIINK